MQNSQIISILTIFILVCYVTTIALTLEESHDVFAAKKRNSEEVTSTASKPSSSASESNSGDDDSSGSSSNTNPTSIPCPDGSIPVKGKCPPTTLSDDSSGAKNKQEEKTTTSSTPSPSESNSGDGTNTPTPITANDGTTDNTDNTANSGDSTNTPTPTTPDSSGGTDSSTPPPSNQGTSSSSSSASSSTTKPSNAKIPQTSVSQSAANAATNQIINSPGSTIVNQQSIKQSVRINNEVNNIIRKSVSVAPSSSTSMVQEKPITNLITVKLSNTMSRNAYLPLADVSPYHLIGGHVTVNIPNNHLYIVVAQLVSSNGAIQHAIVLDLARSQISNTYETDLGSQISGTNPLTGKQDVVSDITNLFLWNNGNQQVTFGDANGVSMNLIYK
jgi:hypothetical protein